MNPFLLFYQFVTDKKVKISHRAVGIIILILFVILIDNVMGFSFSYRMNTKLEQLRKIDAIIQSPTADSITKSYAVNLREDVIHRKSVRDYFFSLKSFLNSSKPDTNKPASIPNKIEFPLRNNFLFFVSKTGVFILGIFAIFWFNLFGEGRKGLYLSDRLGSSFYYSFHLLAGAFTFYNLLDFIPRLRLGSSWNINYMLNVAIQFGFIWLVLYINTYVKSQDQKQKMKELQEQRDSLNTKMEKLKDELGNL